MGGQAWEAEDAGMARDEETLETIPPSHPTIPSHPCHGPGCPGAQLSSECPTPPYIPRPAAAWSQFHLSQCSPNITPEPSLTSAVPRLPGTSGSPGPELVAAASSRSPGLGHRAAAQGPCPLILPAWGSWAGSLSLGSARAAPSEQQQTPG